MTLSACLIQADAVLCALFKVASLRDKNYSKRLKCGNLWHLKWFSDIILYTHSVKLSMKMCKLLQATTVEMINEHYG